MSSTTNLSIIAASQRRSSSLRERALASAVVLAASVTAGCWGEPDCPAGLTECGGECVDLLEDDANCGACGEECPSDMPCNVGMCDPCVNIIGRDRATTLGCFDAASTSWQTAGSFHDAEGVYSVTWRDDSFYEESSIVNWVPDQHWTRRILVFEHASAEPDETSPEDRLVFLTERPCELENHFMGGSTIKTSPGPSSGDLPAPDLRLDCSPWPQELEQRPQVLFESACYASQACEFGTLCSAAQLDRECPAEGSMCLEPGHIPPGDDIDEDGTPNCEDDDLDGDGLLNDEEGDPEQRFPTDPYEPDTDGDGKKDGDDPFPLAPCSNVLFFDDFTEDPSSQWEVVAGVWEWDGQQDYLSTDGSQSGAHVWPGEQSWTDVIVETRLQILRATGAAGVLTRVASVDPTGQDHAHYFTALFPELDVVRFGLTEGTTSVDLGEATTPVATQTWYTLQVRHDMDIYEIYLNNSLVVSGESFAFDHGAVALTTHQTEARFDYILVCQ